MDNPCTSNTVRRDVVILCCDTPRNSDVRAAKLATFLGVDPFFVCLNDPNLGECSSIDEVPPCRCLVVDAESLIKAAHGNYRQDEILRQLAKVAAHIFVYGFQPREDHNALLQVISGGSLTATSLVSDTTTRFRISTGHREWCFQFSGLSLGTVDPRFDKYFVTAETWGPEPLIWAGDKPFIMGVTFEGAHLFLSACSELADMDEELTRQDHVSGWLSRLVPLTMFLRGALGDRVWHGQTPRACFIIDDPLLKERHGFLKMRSLLEMIQQQRSSTSIAFIPWNYDRSNKHVAELFSSESGQASLCVHGCDHSGGEFAARDVAKLTRKARLALHRMQEHRSRYGVRFDPIMVFPQGLFSPEAITALKASGYLAAINSDPYPSTTTETLKLRELLDGAVNRFADFPLFVRRHSNDLVGFAFDLFFGKPVLAVEHHVFFRKGYKALERFVAQLRSLDERIEWTNLAKICSTVCLIKTTEVGEIHVRFWTNQFQLTNRETGTRTYVLFRHWATADPLPSITVGGRDAICEQHGQQLTIRVTLDEGQSADICVMPQQCALPNASHLSFKFLDLPVLFRRLLCEFRDNYIDTNSLLSGIASRGLGLLRTMRSQMVSRPELRERAS